MQGHSPHNHDSKKTLRIAVAMSVLAALVIIGIAIPLHIKGDRSEAMQLSLNPLSSLSATSTVIEIKLAIDYVSEKYGLDKAALYTTIQCESGFDNSKIGDHGLAVGIAQFHPDTFKRFCTGDYHSAKDQLNCMGQMWQKKLQHHWTCWSRYFSS